MDETARVTAAIAETLEIAAPAIAGRLRAHPRRTELLTTAAREIIKRTEQTSLASRQDLAKGESPPEGHPLAVEATLIVELVGDEDYWRVRMRWAAIAPPR